jgi:serine/threonine-protein kinase
MVMELLAGQDLAERLQRGPLSWSAIEKIGDEILSALETTHAQGIVHRDLKPQNVFLARDAAGEIVKLLDFGVSKVVTDDSSSITQQDRILGTPAYMSPEQADGTPADVGPSTDIWSVGAILYEMASGRRAFDAPSTPRVLYRICFGRPDPLLPLRPDSGAAFIDLVERALSRDPERRITNATELRRGLQRAFRGAPQQDAGVVTSPIIDDSNRKIRSK